MVWAPDSRQGVLAGGHDTDVFAHAPVLHVFGEKVHDFLVSVGRGWVGVVTLKRCVVAVELERPEDVGVLDGLGLWTGSTVGVSVLLKGQETLNHEAAKSYVTVPSGHPQGYQDCFSLFMRDVTRTIEGQRVPGLPTFSDGVRAAALTEAVIASARSGGWVDVAPTRHLDLIPS